MKFSVDRRHLPRTRTPSWFGRSWGANALRGLKEMEGNCLQMLYGDYWNFAGCLNQVTGRA